MSVERVITLMEKENDVDFFDGPPPAFLKMEEDKARKLTREVMRDATKLWDKLVQLYIGSAHVTLGYSSWAAYCAAEFGMGKSRAYQVLDAARVQEAIAESTNVEGPRSEAVARELVPVLRDDPQRVERVWGEVVREHGPEPTAAQVREHVLAPSVPPELEETYTFVTEIRFHHDAANQLAAEAWVQRLVERTTRTPGVTCVSRKTRVT